MAIQEFAKSTEGKIMSALTDKPIWAFWGVYSVLTAVLFGIFYTATYLLALKWWLAALVIIAVGVIWGSFVFSRNRRTEKKEEKAKDKA